MAGDQRGLFPATSCVSRSPSSGARRLKVGRNTLFSNGSIDGYLTLSDVRRFRVPALSVCSVGTGWGRLATERLGCEHSRSNRLTACYSISAVFCSLPRASLPLGSSFRPPISFDCASSLLIAERHVFLAREASYQSQAVTVAFSPVTPSVDRGAHNGDTEPTDRALFCRSI